MEGIYGKILDTSISKSNDILPDMDSSLVLLNQKNKSNEYISTLRTQRKIGALVEKIPQLKESYFLHSKVGEGTFSTVYLGTSRRYPWEETQYAIKYLTPTSHPARIGQELRCLVNIGGKDNVVGLVECFRKKDNIVFVMPYLPHEKFSTYMISMDVNEVKFYMKNLLIALRRVHEFNIIHRDVKPSNFLYDRINKRFLLVDFGLAEAVGQKSVSERIAENLIASSKKRKRSILDENENGSTNDSSVLPLKKRQALQPLTNTVNGVPVFKRPLTNENRSLSHLINNMNNQVTDVKISPVKNNNNNNDENGLKQIGNDFLSPKRQPLTSNSVNVQNNISPQKLPCVNLFTGNGNVMNEKRNSRLISNDDGNNKCNISKEISPDDKNSGKVFQTLLPTKINPKSFGSNFLRVQNSQVKPVFTRPSLPVIQKDKCDCDGKAQVCNKCIVRQRQVAPRAGTPGFRPPEVLLKYPKQTTAVDIWAAGVIFLSLVSGCYPFFRSPDDITALAEIMSIFGTNSVKRIAAKFGKTLRSNYNKESENLKVICERLRRRRQEAAEMDARNEVPKRCEICGMFDYPIDGCSCKETCADIEFGMFPDSAFDLLNRMLDLDPDTRITAEEALKHPFLADHEV